MWISEAPRRIASMMMALARRIAGGASVSRSRFRGAPVVVLDDDLDAS
jgi:hypothetical protein